MVARALSTNRRSHGPSSSAARFGGEIMSQPAICLRAPLAISRAPPILYLSVSRPWMSPSSFCHSPFLYSGLS
jgi:hypothetical protein